MRKPNGYKNMISGHFHRADIMLFKRHTMALKQHGVTVNQAIALSHIVDEEETGGINQSTLVEYVGITGPAIARVANELEKMELIVRCIDERDRRCQILMPTQLGREKVLIIRETMVNVDRCFFNGLTEKEKNLFEKILYRLE